MKAPIIICIDDQREVLAALYEELDSLEGVRVLDCESADEALELIQELQDNGEWIALIVCDQIMPGTKGVQFLSYLQTNQVIPNVKTVLLTGLATHEDTIRAINQARVSHYIAKPWDSVYLKKTVRSLLTEWIIESGLDHQNYPDLIDPETLYMNISGD
ncbi:MAG: response regulator [Candidatus Cloacimonetes bacterium]|nr:response regulator [Candidatus Cloacimonadota bacterium]